jgi:hypothetical protein
MRIALAILVIAFSAPAASLKGTVVDQTGAVVPHANVELASGTNKYKTQADETGVYQFSNLPAGEYSLKFSGTGFRNRTVIIGLLESEQKRLPDVTLDIASSGCGGPPPRDLAPLRGTLFGTLSGSVNPTAEDVEVTLVCRTFNVCASTKTDSNGRFSFQMISAGVYGLNFRRDGFYLENATGYSYYVDAGWESVYGPKFLQQCPNGNCDPKLRPILHCE